MSQSLQEAQSHDTQAAVDSSRDMATLASDTSPVIVVGAGPAGQRVVRDILRFDDSSHVMLFGEEPYEPYDRVKLSSYLAGEAGIPLVDNNEPLRHVDTHLGQRITHIDRAARRVSDGEGNSWHYSSLVLATGSRAFIPPVHGVELNNVFSFRNMADAEQLKARTISSRHTVVIGGGLLGLEAARAMRRFNTRVTVIEQSAWLMFRQLDKQAGKLLATQITDKGIDVRTGIRVQSIEGSGRVEYIILTGGERIKCDTVVLATGIQSNLELAREAGLYTRRGILVNNLMQTNDKHIYAIGECAEHQSKVYGLVQPGFEQASVAANVITGGKARYKGSELITQLKLIDSPVFSIGEANTEWHRREVVYQDTDNGRLRKLFLMGNRLDAALAIGDWPEFSRLQELVKKNKRVWPWQLARFGQEGNLWQQDEEAGIHAWPASATVCNCMGVTRGEISDAIGEGCRDVRTLGECTGASTVCGTCRPLLQQMLGAISVEPVRASRLLILGAVVTVVAVLTFLLLPNLSYSHSVQNEWHWDILWRDGFFKQVSGFTLLGLSVVLAFVALPKRIKAKSRKSLWGDFSLWRAAHVVIGMFTLLALVAHTGLRMGNELNQLLMLTFSGLLVAGALLSGAAGLQHRLPLGAVRSVRNWSLWAHILLLWPLPALLGFHILKTYWY